MLRRWTLLALLAGCAANEAGTGELDLEDEGPSTRDGGRQDASRRDARAADPARADARAPVTSGPGACEGDTPHGCYTLTEQSPEGCPEQAPEIPTALPLLHEWDLCSGLAVSAGQTCIWEGPEGGTATCICDLGVHWICVYL